MNERRVLNVKFRDARDSFVVEAHAAWVAQALYRLRFETFTDDELLVGLFGDDYPTDSPAVLRRAKELVGMDISLRGKTYSMAGHAEMAFTPAAADSPIST